MENREPAKDIIYPKVYYVDPSVEQQAQENWVKRNMTKLCLGAFAVSTGISVASGSGEEIVNKATDAAPEIGITLAATEVMWVGGAAIMLASAGHKIGNPLRIRSRWEEIKTSTYKGRGFKTGLNINTIGAVGAAGVIAGGAVTTLPVETWPSAFAVAAVDLTTTAALRAPLYKGIKDVRKKADESGVSSEKQPKISTRKATIDDIDRLADIDLLLFKSAYGEGLPEKQEVVDTLVKRFNNNPDWMFVVELDGVVEGFTSAFKTATPPKDFVSWEESTANGTLDNKVNPDGKYVYVTNLTIKHEAVELGGEEMLLANLFANGIEDGADYGYFVSRMPYFKRWLDQEAETTNRDEKHLYELAEEYFNLRNEEGKRQDKQLRMYEGFGYKLERVVENAFSDAASMDFGVICVAEVPPKGSLKKIKTIRKTMAFALRQIAKRPKILNKVM